MDKEVSIDSVSGDLAVDVYRHNPPLTAVQAQSIADRAGSYDNAVGGLSYGLRQLAGLAAAAWDPWSGSVRWVAEEVDEYDLGREAMICSELVAWSYYDTGFALRVAWSTVMATAFLRLETPLTRWNGRWTTRRPTCWP